MRGPNFETFSQTLEAPRLLLSLGETAGPNPQESVAAKFSLYHPPERKHRHAAEECRVLAYHFEVEERIAVRSKANWSSSTRT